MPIESNIDPAEAWNVIKRNARQIKLLCAGMKSTLAAGGVTIEYVFDQVYRPLLNSKTQLEALAQTSNLNAYVVATTGNALYDAVSEIQSTATAIQACLTWINNNAEGLSLEGDTADNYIVSGSVAADRFTAAQTSGLRTLLDAVTASIND